MTSRGAKMLSLSLKNKRKDSSKCLVPKSKYIFEKLKYFFSIFLLLNFVFLYLLESCESSQTPAVLHENKSTTTTTVDKPICGETLSCFNSGMISNDDLSKLVNEYFPHRVEMDTSMDKNIDPILEESFDDSDADPNYIPDDKGHDSETESDDDEIEALAKIIENNITTDADDPELISEEQSLVNSDEQIDETTMEIEASVNLNRKEIKIKRNSGLSYKTAKGKLIKDRRCIPLESCRMKCREKLKYSDQYNIFKRYWSLGSYNARVLYISGLMELKDVKFRSAKTISNKKRSHSCSYHVDVNGISTSVCQKCFRFIHGETDNFLKTVMKKKLNTDENLNLLDKRGKTVPLSKISESKIAEIKNHIYSFPAYVSHYSRRHTSQKYFSSDLNISKLYKLYTEKYNDSVSLTKYTEIFKGLYFWF